MTFDEFITEWRGHGEFIVAHTSGSTGTPKLIRLRKEFVRRSAERTNSFFSINQASRLHSCVAADFIGGKMMAVRSEIAGCVFTYENPSNKPLEGFGVNDRIDLLAVVSSQMLHIVGHVDDMPALGAVIVGGSAIDKRLRRRIIDSGINAYESYGMTETSSHIALRKIDSSGAWFECLPGISVNVDDRGCLVIMFDSGEQFVTNDLAVVSDGRYFRILGRADDIIITGGKKLNPHEVEDVISEILDVPFVVTSVPHEKWGREVILKIEGEMNIDSDNLLHRLRELLPGWKVPKRIVRVKSIPRTRNGKIVR